MALKAILESLDGLPDAIKSEYKKGEDGKYHLDVEGGEDTGALKRAKDYEKSTRQKVEKELADTKAQLEALTEERDGILKGAIPKGDVEKLEGSWKQKLEKREKELTDQLSALNGSLQTMLVDNVAQGLASKISKSPELMLPHIKARLKAELVDGKPTTRVLDKEGNISALGINELEAEMVSNPAFAPIIIGSKASGSGAGGGQGGSGAPSKLDFAKASPKEIAAHIRATKESGGS
jgi:hypothetical protein